MSSPSHTGMNPEPNLGSLEANVKENHGTHEPVGLGVGKREDGQSAGREACRDLLTDHPSDGLGGVIRFRQVSEAPHSFVFCACCIRACIQLGKRA